jgi:hypothetical protein
LEYVAAHEVRHVWQKSNRKAVFEDECRAEGDAYPYGYEVLKNGYEVLKKMLKAQGRLTTEVRANIDQMRAKAEKVFLAERPEGVFRTLAT